MFWMLNTIGWATSSLLALEASGIWQGNGSVYRVLHLMGWLRDYLCCTLPAD